ncbi:class I SAM-dependent RNA methyltransferase [Marinoscillum sp. MHG1-6]|uniref:THUMP domain-containing class I SAM-dependent RNA methyltransferase n=1 Tax=Marinoscillum sp. MHG1-6 TaxID=2959627 RepID=UPI00215783CF|nr:THUMP domain-containing protein [Marinoscillum sp. MHG1-6]
MKLLIKTLHGLEEVLAEEVKAIGATNVKILKRSVACEGDLEVMYRANLHLRTALKVLVPVHRFTARTEDELYKAVYAFDWSKHLNSHKTFAIDNTVFSEYFRHSKYAALKTKDAIVDQFRNKMGSRPSIDVKSPDIQLDLHAVKDQFTISLDSSGEPLNKRGYREPGHEAPLNEVLAAGLILLSGWKKESPLIDPMCGSGTILIEAAMIGQNMAPQLHRKDFGFKNWKSFQPAIWNKVLSEAKAAVRKTTLNIRGGDINFKAVSIAEKSIRNFKLSDSITVRRIAFEKSFPGTADGVIISNPPYGERIGENVNELYGLIGDTLKNNYSGFDAWLISSNMEAFKHLRLRPSKKLVLFNGPLECKFQKYEMYRGSKED